MIVNYATCENIIVIGLDGADDPLDISKIMIGLRKGNGLVIASRFAPGGSRETDRALSYRSIGNRFFSFMLSIIFSNNITDSNNLFRGFKKSVWSKLQLKQTGDSIMFEQTLQVLENKIPFSEFPTHERKSLSKRRRRNRFLSALEFLFILAKYLFNPRTQGKRRRL
ncbi:MAG: hypothetical protein NTV34_19350 [Proteobacteria bacterium]|nr:hypothetical protein [Pseudomonadota bacterium]